MGYGAITLDKRTIPANTGRIGPYGAFKPFGEDHPREYGENTGTAP